jgi:hypothetical protein
VYGWKWAVTTGAAGGGGFTNVDWGNFEGSAGVISLNPSQMKFPDAGLYVATCAIRFIPAVPALGQRAIRFVVNGLPDTLFKIDSTTANEEWLVDNQVLRVAANSTWQVHVFSSGADVITLGGPEAFLFVRKVVA